MIYGLYQSATGVLTNSHRQDVIANNLANAETVGFKRNLPLFQERLSQALSSRQWPRQSDPMLDLIGAGPLPSPTAVDRSQGQLEHTGNRLDAAILGGGYFAVQDGSDTRLTRDGRFMIDRGGYLVLANGSGNRVLDARRQPIRIDPELAPQLVITEDGQVSANGEPLARIGLFDVPNPAQLVQRGGTLLGYSQLNQLRPSSANLQSGFVERSNVDPTLELTALMDAQRQIEANANMIRYQDQTLGRLVNDVGRIG